MALGAERDADDAELERFGVVFEATAAGVSRENMVLPANARSAMTLLNNAGGKWASCYTTTDYKDA